MTLEEAVQHIQLLAERFNLSNDSRFNEERAIAHLIHVERASAARARFRKTGKVDSSLIQRFGTVKVREVTMDDDPDVAISECKIGKVIVPGIIHFPYDRLDKQSAIINVSGPAKMDLYGNTSQHNFVMALSSDSWRVNQKFYFHQGNALYIYPYKPYIDVSMVLSNPEEGMVIDNGYILPGNLIDGEDYTVQHGSITHDGTVYNQGDTFTATSKDYTGNGGVRRTTMKRSYDWKDKYPISEDLFNAVEMGIFRNDMVYEQMKKSDEKSDSRDQELMDENE